MKIRLFAIAILMLFPLALSAGNQDIRGGVLDKNVNSEEEDYGSYLIYGQGTDTLFFTSSRPVPNRRPIAMAAEIFYSTRPSSDRNSKAINEGWSQAQRIVTDATRIAEFTRGSQTISKDRIIFAAERDLSTKTAQGTSYLFDLWQMTKRIDGFSLPEPITEVNDPDAWDSQPALSQDGKILFFVSNRTGGKGGLDIWYSVRDASGSWTKPLLVPNINTPGDEVSPHCGADGKFYFSTDWDYAGDKKGSHGRDIYRCDYITTMGIQLPTNPVALDEAFEKDAKTYGVQIPKDISYNSDKDDEFPFISPDRKAIFLTSNRNSDFKKRNIFAFALPKSKIQLIVSVREQTLDANGNVIIPPAYKTGLPLTLLDEKTGLTQEITSGERYEVESDRTYQIRFSKFVEQECYQNKIEGPNELKVKTVRPYGPDTLFATEALITRQKIDIPPIIFHSTDSLPYFVTGYWYPNTSENIAEYRKREASGFFDQTGFVDSTGHDYDGISKKIDDLFTTRIYQPLEKLMPIFQDFCQDTLFLKVTIHGYTDPRGLSAGEDHPYRKMSQLKRTYPDETITVGTDERGQAVTIGTGTDMFRSSWPKDPNNKQGSWIKLADEGEKGNILLSKLRAYFTFVTFDRDMRKRSPIYAQMRDNGRVILDAEGFGIDKQGFKERNLRDDPMSRRIEIYLDILRPEEIDGYKRLQGGKIQNLAANKPAKPGAELKEPEKEIEITIQNPPGKPDQPGAAIDESSPEAIARVEVIEKAKEPEPLPPTEDEPKDSPVIEKGCYAIQFNTFDSEQEAMTAMDIVSNSGATDVKVVEFLDAFGKKSYRLRAGCYNTKEEAIKAIDSFAGAAKALNLKRKPIIVR